MNAPTIIADMPATTRTATLITVCAVLIPQLDYTSIIRRLQDEGILSH